MHSSLFSDKDKVQFFEVIKDINEHLHHVKQYDKVEDIERHAELFEKIMGEMKKLIIDLKKHFLSIKKIGDESIKQEVISDQFFRANMTKLLKEFREDFPFEECFENFLKVNGRKNYLRKILEKIYQKKVTAILLNKKGKNFYKKLKRELEKIHLKWQELIIEFDIIIQKIREIQDERSRYFKLLQKRISNVNEAINISKFKIRKYEEKMEKWQKAILKEDLDCENSEQLLKAILNIFSFFIEVKTQLNDLNIERNKMMPVAPIYASFIHELQQPQSAKVRVGIPIGNDKKKGNEFKILFKEKMERIQWAGFKLEKIKNNEFLKGILNRKIEKKKEELKDYLLKEKKFKNSLNSFLKNIGILIKDNIESQINEETLTKIKNEVNQLLIKNGQAKDTVEPLLSEIIEIIGLKSKNGPEINVFNRVLTILYRLTFAELKEFYEDLGGITNLKGEKKNWDTFVKLVTNLQSDDFKDRKGYSLVARLNNLLEVYSIKNLLRMLHTLPFKFIADFFNEEADSEYPDPILYKEFIKLKNQTHDNLWSRHQKIEEYLKRKLEEEAFKVEAKKREFLEKLLRHLIREIKSGIRGFGYAHTKQELEYFIRCSKEHAKWYNNRVFADFPTPFDTFGIKNPTLEKYLDNKNYSFSSKFRKIFRKLDAFLEKSLYKFIIPIRTKEEISPTFFETKEYIISKLESLKVGQYEVLDEYLNSQKFTDVTDRLQVYSGAFGIWNEEAGELVRVQDRRYCHEDYRPQIEEANKWYDLTDRKIEANHWGLNDYEQSIDLMFMTVRDRAQVYPEFYQNLSKDNNFLNTIEKDHSCVFCEDGEISAFILAYRFLNMVFHSHISQKYFSNFMEGKLENLKDYSTAERLKEALRNLKSPKKILEEVKEIKQEGIRLYLERKKYLDTGLETTDRLKDEIKENEKKRAEYLEIFEYFYEDVNFLETFIRFYDIKKRNNKTSNIPVTPLISDILLHIFQKIDECHKFLFLQSKFTKEHLSWTEELLQRNNEILISNKKSIEKNKHKINNNETANKNLTSNVNNIFKSLDEKIISLEKTNKSFSNQINRRKSYIEDLEDFNNQIVAYNILVEKIRPDLEKYNKNKGGGEELIILQKIFEISNSEQCQNFLAFELKLWKYHLYQFIRGLLEVWNKNVIEFKMEAKKLPFEFSEGAYNKMEAKARREKFYTETYSNIPSNLKTFLRELTTQGLLESSNKERDQKESWDTPYFKITERYVNLCKFIERELNASNLSHKVKLNFDPNRKEVNPDEFFIDIKIKGLKNKQQKKYRIDEVRSILRSIKDIVEDNYQLNKVAKDDFIHQISQILMLSLENLIPYFCNEDKFLKDYQKNLSHDENTDFENFFFEQEEGIDRTWRKIKDKVDEICKFPISPWLVWRANGNYALSHLVIPLASTTIKASSPNVGFIILGIRNIIEDEYGRLVHVTHTSDEQFRELIFSLRAIFQPLIHPLMDKIYYEQIINKSVQDNSMRAGVARVMARNLSHNIGSHVLEKLTRFKSEKLKKYQDFSESYLNNFHAFLRTRMGFIADVSTGQPYVTVPAWLNKDVLIEFKQKIRILGKDGKKDTFPNNKDRFQIILFDLLSGDSQFGYDKIKINFKKEAEGKDIDFALPNSHLGAHALYVLIENIIRNAFKHIDNSKLKGDKLGLELEIDYHVPEGQSDLYKLTIKDNFGKYRDNSDAENLKNELKNKLQTPIINEKNRKLELKNWGLLEMKIGAAYLRRIDLPKMDKIQQSHQKLINVEVDNESNLIHEIFLEVPKLLEIVFWNHDEMPDREVIKNWANHGISIKRKQEYDKISDTNIDGRSKFLTSSYQFQVFLCSKEELINEIDSSTNQGDVNFNVHRVEFLPKENHKEEEMLDQRTLISYLVKNSPMEDRDKILQQIWAKRVKTLVPLNLKDNKEQTKDSKIDLPHILYSYLKVLDSGVTERLIEQQSSKEASTTPWKKNDLTAKMTDKKWRKKTIFLDDHGEILFDLVSKNPILYYESYHSIDPTGFLMSELQNKKYGPPKQYLYDKIIEAAFTDIGILEERIQEELEDYKEDKKDEKRSRQALERMKVFVPDKEAGEVDLGRLSEEDVPKIIEWIGKIHKENHDGRPLDFLVIHIKLIEKIVGTSEKNIYDFIKRLKRVNDTDLTKEKREEYGDFQVILTSGRGIPNNLPKGVPFIHVSVLMRFLFEQPSKFSLTDLLFSANMKGGIKK